MEGLASPGLEVVVKLLPFRLRVAPAFVSEGRIAVRYSVCDSSVLEIPAEWIGELTSSALVMVLFVPVC